MGINHERIQRVFERSESLDQAKKVKAKIEKLARSMRENLREPIRDFKQTYANAWFDIRDGKFDKAMYIFKRIIKDKPNSEMVFGAHQGLFIAALLQSGNFTVAKPFFLKILECWPEALGIKNDIHIQNLLLAHGNLSPTILHQFLREFRESM